MNDIERTEAAGLLGKIGRLYRDDEVLDVAPIVSKGGHEIEALKIVTEHGKFVVSITTEEDYEARGGG